MEPEEEAPPRYPPHITRAAKVMRTAQFERMIERARDQDTARIGDEGNGENERHTREMIASHGKALYPLSEYIEHAAALDAAGLLK